MKIERLNCDACERPLKKDHIGTIRDDYAFCSYCLDYIIRSMKLEIMDFIKQKKKEKQQRMMLANSNAVREVLK